jgi:Luciferase-like monooxygenase
VKFGYFTLMDNPPAYGARRRDPNRFFHEVMEEAVFAEAIGLHSVWLPEHHFGLFGCLGATSTALGYLAARTSRIKLAPATIVLPCHHPVAVAEPFCTLDQVSGGHQEVGGIQSGMKPPYVPPGAAGPDAEGDAHPVAPDDALRAADHELHQGVQREPLGGHFGHAGGNGGAIILVS